jgi:hypothetical protein
MDKCSRLGAKQSGQIEHQNDNLNWESLAQRKKIARTCTLFKGYAGERAWKVIIDRLQKPCCLSRVDHDKKITRRSKKQKTGVGKLFFVNRTIQLWNQLPADALGTLSCKPRNFRKSLGK